MKLLSTGLVLAAAILVFPVLSGYAADSPPAEPLASSFDATTLTTLAANGIEQVATPGARDEAMPSVDADVAVAVARREIGGAPRAAVLGPFTDHAGAISRRRAWQILVGNAALPSGERGRAWIAIDPVSGAVLAARPLRELDAA